MRRTTRVQLLASVGVLIACGAGIGQQSAAATESGARPAGGEPADSTCRPAKLAEVRQPATPENPSVAVDCDLTLGRTDVITKSLQYTGAAASGATLDCNGATLNGATGTVNYRRDMIQVRSRRYQDSTGALKWERPVRVTIRNCNIVGSVRVWGMAVNGEGRDLRDSSRLPGHVARARNNAPWRIVLDRVRITGVGRIPLYLSPGVSYLELTNSEIRGRTVSVNVYLDAESFRNTITNNTIHAKTSKREVMAIDGSSYNTIANNRFSALNHGGIYLYRNCGEGGTIRHSTPSNNRIASNVFYYNRYRGSRPSVFLGSRNGNRRYCGDDRGYPYGSSVSNLDYARYNAVKRNQIYKRSVRVMIRVGRRSTDRPNYVRANRTVDP